MIGQTLDDRYAILRLIGQGGMGAVYEARHVGTQRRVAVKVILGAAMDSDQVARFQREASIVGSIESQHITLAYDTGRDRVTGAPYIAMELLDGEDAEHLLERLGPLPTDLTLRIGYQACLGLGRAHQAGIVHRDIKTANLFLHRTETGQRIVKLLDFGIAKSTGGEIVHPSLTRTGTMMGSPLYMSPEQAKGGRVDARSDVWSLGITLYELLCGVRPNEHVQQLGELIVAICTQPALPLSQKAPHVPPEVAAIVHRALSIDASARFASAVEMGEAVKAFLPGGHVLEESMLRADGVAAIAQRAAQGAPSSVLAQSAPMGGPSGILAPATMGGEPSHPGSAQSGTTRGVSLGTSAALASSAPSRAPLFVGAILVTAIGGVGAGVWFGRGSPAPARASVPGAVAVAASEAPTAAASVPVTPTPPAQPVVTPSASAVVTAAASAPTAAARAPTRAPPRAAASSKPIIQKASSDDESSRK